MVTTEHRPVYTQTRRSAIQLDPALLCFAAVCTGIMLLPYVAQHGGSHLLCCGTNTTAKPVELGSLVTRSVQPHQLRPVLSQTNRAHVGGTSTQRRKGERVFNVMHGRFQPIAGNTIDTTIALKMARWSSTLQMPVFRRLFPSMF